MSQWKKTFSLKRQLKSFQYAFRGLSYVFRHESNMQVHLMAMLFVLIAGWYFQISRIEWIAVVGIIVLVMALEAINTSIEAIVDLVSPDYHELAGRAKDVAAGAVTIAAIGAIIIGILVFLPKLGV